MCRYILAAPNVDANVKHNLKAILGNGLRPQIWKQFVEKFNIKQVFEFYGATEGISNMGKISIDFLVIKLIIILHIISNNNF